MGMFDGILNAVTSPVASLVGSLTGAVGSYMGTQSANQANIDIANAANQQSAANIDKTNQFNAQQFATRYQTTVKDLEQAGLNPMLAYSQGGGTPIPAQAAPVQVAAPRQNALGNAISSAQASLLAMNAFQQNELLKAQVNKTDEEADLVKAQKYNVLDENPYIKDKYKAQIVEMDLKRAQARYSSATGALAEQGKGLTHDQPIYQDIKKHAASAYEAWGKLVDKSYSLTPWRK